MPTQLQQALHTTSTQPAPEPDAFVRYPPFPTLPPGVVLVPFARFQPRGIPIALEGAADDDGERDGLGVRTVRLRVEHAPVEDGAEGRKRKKRKKGGAGGGVTIAPGPSAGERRVPWWELWKDEEEVKGIRVLFDA